MAVPMTSILRADSELEGVSIGYDTVEIRVQDPFGKARTGRACGYVGFEYVGVWDKSVIERAEYTDTNSFADSMGTQICSHFPGGPPETVLLTGTSGAGAH